MAPGQLSEPGEPTWVWAIVEVKPDGSNGRCVFRVCRKTADSINNAPRGTGELTRFVQCHAFPNNLVVSDGWAATRAIDWPSLQLRHEWCNHSRTLKKGIRRRTLTRTASAASTESMTHATKVKGNGNLIPCLWLNRRGFHSNNVESLFNQVKKWCRKRNGTLPRTAFFKLYLSSYMFRHNFAEDTWADRHLEALKLLAKDIPEIDM